MKNKYIEITPNNRDELRTSMQLSIPSINLPQIGDIDVKIDTGCPRTSIPVKKLGINDEDAYRLKQIDCKNEYIKKEISFGVNDSNEKREADRAKFKDKKYNLLSSITFTHSDADIVLDGVAINHSEVKLSYDRTGNILIGMDILKNWDIHMGISKVSGKTLFLACPYDMLNDEYFKALNKHFDLGDGILTAEI